jgi:hypothetical protein
MFDPLRLTPGRRRALGFLAGFGATGIAAGFGLLGQSVDIRLPVFDPSGLILMAALIVLPGASGWILRENDAAAATAVGATAAPIVAVPFVGDCREHAWAFLGLAAGAGFALIISGLAAFAGAWLGREATTTPGPRRTGGLVAASALGIGAWLIAAALLFRCP